MGNKREAAPAQPRERFRILQCAVEPNATAYLRVRLVQTHDCIGKQRLARTARPHHGHDLACMHGNGQSADDGNRFLLRREEGSRIRVVHAKAHRKILYLQQMMPLLVPRCFRVRMVMVRLPIGVRRVMVRLPIGVRGMFSNFDHVLPSKFPQPNQCNRGTSSASNRLTVPAHVAVRQNSETPYSWLLWGSISFRRLWPARSNSSTTATSAKPGNTASHHIPAER